MTEHDLGGALRAALEQERQRRGGRCDPRRLEARLPQLVASDQLDLLPALSFLLRSRALASALEQPATAGDPRLVARLQQEVEGVFSPAVGQRLQAVIEGLMGIPLPAQHGGPVEASMRSPQPPAPPSQSLSPSVTTVVTGGGGGANGLVAMLCFLIGVLGSGLLVLVWMQRQARQAEAPIPPSPTPLSTNVPPPPTAPSPADIAAEEASSTSNAPAGANADLAVSAVQQLYGALSAKDFTAAAALFGPMAADQFDPTFFNQFERVSVGDLRQTSSVGSTVNLEGVVTFVYSNGDLQTETRSFSVDTGTSPALITASEFGRVLRAR